MEDRKTAPLRRGWTTGACAAGAAGAACEALLTGHFSDPVTIILPKGLRASFVLAGTNLEPSRATAGVVKDAGDDPDITHGALILATVRKGPAGSGMTFRAGPGVGTVTRPGLPLAVGEPAINPAPRRMIAQALARAAEPVGAPLDFVVEIAIPGGEDLAVRTLNPRLGIVGGLSVLGTTGVVVPYSSAAWALSIHRAVDVARACGWSHVAASTGAASEAAVRRLTGLPDEAIIDMGDAVGALLKYLRRAPVARLTLCGGFGKMCKLAQGALDLHSSRSRIDLDRLAGLLADLGAAPALVERARRANTASEVLDLARASGLPLGDLVAAGAHATVRRALEGKGRPEVVVVVVDRQGEETGLAS